MKFVLCALVLTSAATGSSATMADRSYDGAITCKALSLLASRVTDPASKSALKLIEAEIEKEIARGKTREQAAADVEYARFEWHDTMSQETIDVEWVACVDRWTD